jgi:hypothetical protein
MTQPVKNRPKTTVKVSILPLILAALGGGTIVFILSQLQFSAWIEPNPNAETTLPIIDTNPLASPKASHSPSSASSVPVSAPHSIQNGLRVSNQSSYAIRVVLLSRQRSGLGQAEKGDRQPAHWDFAPSEGSQAGLLLSLPKQKLTLAPGDILVAFALDGSRHYWGPYVVGETAVPTQSPASLEWQLVLRP